MKGRAFAAVLAGLVSFILAIALLVYFDPFKSLFDRVFVKQEDPPLSNVEYRSIWHESETEENLPELKKIIDRYFECFYSALGDRGFEGERVMEGFFVDSCTDSVYSLAAMTSGAVRLSRSNIDLSLSAVRTHIRLESVVRINKDGYIYTLKQSAELTHKAMKGIGSGEGIYTHTFIFERIGGSWYLTFHECEGGAWSYAKKALDALCGTDAPSYAQLYGAYPKFAQKLAEKAKSNAALIRNAGYETSYTQPNIVYNRKAAEEYARRWSSVISESRNIEQWTDYDNDSGNFVSQCIYSGVGEMDTRGNYIWKWFGPYVNYEKENEGCSMSWTEGDNFHLYCTGNDRIGLYALADAAGGQIEKGDVVQLITDGSAVSQAIVTDIVTDVYGNKLDFLVCGHDSDLVSYPVSALHCDEVRFIKILGYNKD